MNNLSNTPSIKDSTDEAFMVDVIEASKQLPIIVDFWAPWCGPCKTLGPALEAAVMKNKKKIQLVKIDIDKNPKIASQLRVQSIPAVFAFSNGQPVDGFMGAKTPSEIQTFITKTIDNFGPQNDDLTSALASAKEMMEENDYSAAIEIFEAVIKEDASLPDAHAGLIKCLLVEKSIDKAKLAYDSIPDSIKENKHILSAASKIQLAEQTSMAGNLFEVKEKFLASPKDLNLKFELALALIAEEQNQEAIDTLLEIIHQDGEWDGGKAKNQLIELLDALGPDNQLGRAGRRKLSSIIFS